MKALKNGGKGFWSGVIEVDSVQYSFKALNKNGTVPNKLKASIKVAAAQLEQRVKPGLGPGLLCSDVESDDEPRVAEEKEKGQGPAKKKKTQGA